jgi:hypothetical protein
MERAFWPILGARLTTSSLKERPMSERFIDDFFKKMKRDVEYEALHEFEACMTPILRCRNGFSGSTERRYHPPPLQTIPTGPYGLKK